MGLLTGVALVAVAYAGSATAQMGNFSEQVRPASVTVSVPVPTSGTGDTYVQDDTDNVADMKVRIGISHGSPMRAGLQFNLNVPQGAAISAASLTVRQTYAAGDAPALTLRAEASDNAAPYVSQPLISTRSTGQASVPWTANGSSGTTYDSPDFAAVVQEVVNRPGWSSNNLISILIDGPASGPNASIEIAAAETPANQYAHSHERTTDGNAQPHQHHGAGRNAHPAPADANQSNRHHDVAHCIAPSRCLCAGGWQCGRLYVSKHSRQFRALGLVEL